MKIGRKSSANFNNTQNRPAESVETAGSLAMGRQNGGLFSANSYDSFISSNPFTQTFSFGSYSAPSSDAGASSGFSGSFTSAASTVSTGSTASAGGGFSGASCGSSCGGGGGFSSVC